MAPKRTREHRLEDESRIRFAAMLPSEWVVRSVEKDYGIDSEVEIFVGEDPTGLVFKAQLKGTESLHGRPAYRSIKISHLGYWASLDVPVLIVLYVADIDDIFIKWSFAHDPGLKGYSQKTSTVHFRDSDRLINRVAAIKSEVLMHRAIAAGHIPVPVPIEAVGRGTTATSRYEFLLAFRQRVASLGLADVVEVTARSIEPALVLEFADKISRLAMPLNAGSISIHPKRGERFDMSDTEAIDLGLMLVASLLSTRGETSKALRIYKAVGPSDIWFLPEVARRVSFTLEAENEPQMGVSIARVLLASAQDHLDVGLAAIFAESAQTRAADLSEDETRQLVDLLNEIADKFLSIGDPASAVAMCLNGFNVRTKRSEYADAVEQLQRATRAVPDIVDEEFYQNLLAGCAFRAGDHKLAAANYRLLVERGEATPQLLANYGDALFSIGSYSEALKVFEGQGGDALADRLSLVSAVACREIIQVTGLESQSVRPLTEDEIEVVEADTSHARKMLADASALEFMLWYHLEPRPEEWTLGRACLLARLNFAAVPI